MMNRNHNLTLACTQNVKIKRTIIVHHFLFRSIHTVYKVDIEIARLYEVGSSVTKRTHFVRWSYCYATVYNLFYSFRATRYIPKCSHPLDDLWSTFFVIIKPDVKTPIPEVHKWLSTLLGFYKYFCLGRNWWFSCSGFFELFIKNKFLKLKHPFWFAYGCLLSDWTWSKKKMSNYFLK